MNTRYAAAATVVILVLGGCKDFPEAPIPTAVESQLTAEAAVEEQAGAAAERSSVCTAYEEQLGRSEAELAEDPGSSALEEKVASFRAMITDACN